MHSNRFARVLILSSIGLFCGACSSAPVHADAQATTPVAAPDPAPVAAAGLGDQSNLDQILKALDDRGESLTGLKATVKQTAIDTSIGQGDVRSGKVWIARSAPPAGNPHGPRETKMRISFDQLVRAADPTKTILEKIDYILSGDTLIDREAKAKTETHTTIRAAGDKTDILKLGEGPFPLPIGQPPGEVRQQFEVTKPEGETLWPDDSKHPGLLVVELRPRADTKMAKTFESITIGVDPKLSMPTVIWTTDVNKTTMNLTTLEDVQINDGVKDEDFTLPPLPEGWQVVDNDNKPQ